MSDTNCTDCAAPFPVLKPGESGGTGYATRTADMQRICYACADRHEREHMADPTTDRAGVYLSSDGQTVTTWTGGLLGNVISSRPVNVFGRAGTLAIRVRAMDGAIWYGRGTCGMVLALRRAKG